MSRRGKTLFLTLLITIIATQVVLLDWGPEATFFVTWLFLALAVQHDSRISAGVGLVFLATCPFLLIAEKEAVAEQAANYAYFFLAIGVLVQMEELLLERYGRQERKLDFSNLWRPLTQALGRSWSAAVQALGRQRATAGRTRLVRLIQIVGTAGLAIVFMWAAFSGAQLLVVLPLLGGALLFPFIIWGLWLAARTLGPTWLLRTAVALVVLPLAAIEMVWLYNLISADRLARMETTYDFVDHLDEAGRTSPTPEGETVEARAWTIESVPQRVLYQHPAFAGAGRISYTIDMERGTVLAFEIATAPGSWEQPGDGVSFAVYAQTAGATEQLFSAYIDPKNDPADRRWHPHTLDLSAYAGQTVALIFETGSGPAGDYRYDWAGWGRPRLLER